ncbi:MAG: hypothetical protein IJT94_04150, partial [Oscillibacter sp.]|nr:hypothetical protein [Oscillibacter sp.]
RLLTEFYAVLRYFYLDMDIVFTASEYYDLLADVIITLIFMCLNWVYFSKRRLLFTPLPD